MSSPTHVLLTLEELDERIKVAVVKALGNAIDIMADRIGPAVIEALDRRRDSGPRFVDRESLARIFGVSVTAVDLECRRGMPRFHIDGKPWFDVQKCLDWCATPPESRHPHLRAVPPPDDAPGGGS